MTEAPTAERRVWLDLRWAARCPAHQALMSSRRREGDSRFLAIGTLLLQYTAQSVAREGLSRQTLIYRTIPIFEMNVESYRRRAALERKRQGPGRPANYATSKNVAPEIARDNQPEG